MKFKCNIGDLVSWTQDNGSKRYCRVTKIDVGRDVGSIWGRWADTITEAEHPVGNPTKQLSDNHPTLELVKPNKITSWRDRVTPVENP